jgi:DNA-binding response OmpR family regulator
VTVGSQRSEGMGSKMVHLLHVEDDPMQHALVRQLVAGAPDRRFEITTAVSEEEAVATFDARHDIVVLDYHLVNGDGLSCLRSLRKLRPRVPILVLSGAATPEIAAELLEAGADDFFAKTDFDGDLFLQRLLGVLARQEAWEQRVGGQRHSGSDAAIDPVRHLLDGLIGDFLAALPDDFDRRIEELVALSKRARFSEAQIHRLLNQAAIRHAPESEPDGTAAVARVRPLLLEVLLRTFA